MTLKSSSTEPEKMNRFDSTASKPIKPETSNPDTINSCAKGQQKHQQPKPIFCPLCSQSCHRCLNGLNFSWDPSTRDQPCSTHRVREPNALADRMCHLATAWCIAFLFLSCLTAWMSRHATDDSRQLSEPSASVLGEGFEDDVNGGWHRVAEIYSSRCLSWKGEAWCRTS